MRYLLSISFVLVTFLSFGQDIDQLKKCFPTKKARQFVYDAAGVLGTTATTLNNELQAFTDSTSNVIVVLVPETLCGYDKSTYTIEYGDQMGVGRADLDNGIVLMVLPKEISETGKGETFIAVGTGLQGAITDLGTGRIINHEMIPSFKQKDYKGGIYKAVQILKQLASGEISEDKYLEETNGSWIPFVIVLVMIIVFVIISRKNDDFEDYDKNGKRTTRRRPFIFVGPGGFGGGGGGFSGGGGGFGGFGGGGFSGGGAGGSW